MTRNMTPRFKMFASLVHNGEFTNYQGYPDILVHAYPSAVRFLLEDVGNDQGNLRVPVIIFIIEYDDGGYMHYDDVRLNAVYQFRFHCPASLSCAQNTQHLCGMQKEIRTYSDLIRVLRNTRTNLKLGPVLLLTYQPLPRHLLELKQCRANTLRTW